MAEPVRRARGSYGPTVLVGLVGAVLAAVAGAKDWATAAGSAAGMHVSAAVKGSEAAPLATALGLVALAAWGVVLVTRGRVRQGVAVVGGLAALGVLVATVAAFGAATDQVAAALVDKGASPSAAAGSLTGWYWTTAVGAVLAVAAFAVAVRKARGWPAMGAKYDAPGTRAEEPATEQDLWRAMDRGHDPT